MTKNKFLPEIIISAAVIVAAIVFIIASGNKPKEKDELTYFWSESCPHCKDILDYIQENNFDKKYKINKKEVSKNPKNLSELAVAYQKCGLDIKQLGVPLLLEKDNCHLGNNEILNFFSNQSE